jgi:hypothetical protein
MTLNNIFSLTIVLVALCSVAFASTLKPQPLSAAGQPAPKARLQRINDACEKTYGVNSSQSVDCFFKRMAAEAASHPITRHQVRRRDIG